MMILSKNWYFSVQKALIYYTVNKSHHNSFILLVFSHVANFRYVANFRFLTLPIQKVEIFLSLVLGKSGQRQTNASQHVDRNDTTSSWMCTNQRRVNYLREKCQNMKAAINYHHARVVVDSKHNLLYCEVSKAGCTSVKGIWIEANHRSPGSKTMNASGLQVRGESAHKRHNLQMAGIHLHKINNWTNQFKQDIKFITVRHPYDRLVSGYYNLRFFKPGRGDALPYVTQHFKQRFHSSIHGDLKLLTFEQFLTVVTDTTIRIYQDRHWKPYTESCYVCHIEYDYILKTETLYSDMEQITKHLGHPDMKLTEVKMNAYKRDTDSARPITDENKPSGTGWQKHLPEFETLSPGIKQAVAQRYRNDMEMFGYHFDEKTNMASCSYDASADSGCC